MKMILKLSIPFCIAIWFWTWGVLMADIEFGNPMLDPISECKFNSQHYRNHLAASCFFAMLPPLWLFSPFVTGFYEHGWTLSRPVCQQEKP